MRASENGSSSKGKEAKIEMLLTDLPTGIIMEILSWLPLKSIFKCRCVCKTWLQIISENPHFAKLHLSRSTISILIHNEKPEREAEYLRLYQVVQALDSGFIQIEETIFRPRLNLPDSPFDLVNSCNGLVLLRGNERKLVYVCNLVLDECITIKVPEEDNRHSIAFCFGFSVKTNQYKVVQTFFYGEPGEDFKAELYTVGTGSWRSLGNAPFCLNLGYTCFNTFLHGAYHWVECLNLHVSDEIIVCFDFENDMFREFPLPTQIKPKASDHLKLGVIEDSLYACCYHNDDSYQFDIWVMKDYGVKESWTKQFRIKHTFLSHTYFDYYYPLMLLKNGRMLISYNDSDVVCYNLKRKRFIETNIYAKRNYFFMIAYTPCFISLKDVARGEQILR
ncbi:hypothetical protein COLO4_34989 [Corchorus olitorius]|uniref:F-box domain-containing protein n=1 Tax=Corchorus olitorius TaxID=93759 RepID=A0A1R3GIJ6_9ROSI|nr:hypothetical protein COLO4_34989 [Corchorus olitorius]